MAKYRKSTRSSPNKEEIKLLTDSFIDPLNVFFRRFVREFRTDLQFSASSQLPTHACTPHLGLRWLDKQLCVCAQFFINNSVRLTAASDFGIYLFSRVVTFLCDNQVTCIKYLQDAADVLLFVSNRRKQYYQLLQTLLNCAGWLL